jgi:hypothetical protein
MKTRQTMLKMMMMMMMMVVVLVNMSYIT